MEKPSKTATDLKTLINHAMQDLEVTPTEYQRITELAQNDGVLDREEKALLSQFNEMVSNGTISRILG
jgi:tellurite resistance protein